MFRLRTLGTSALLLTLAASLCATGCRRRTKVVYAPQPGPPGPAGPAGPASPGATPGTTVINLTLNITASSTGLTRITTDPGDAQIFINGQHVGGCDDLYALDKDGKLDGLLAA